MGDAVWDVRTEDVDLLGQNGIQLTQGLFHEFNTKGCLYTMASRDKGTAISVPRIYMQSVDEYEAAMRITGSMDHWRKLCGLKWFTEGMPERNLSGLNQWREDMRARDASNAKRQLIEVSKSGSVPASRYLHEVSVKGKSETSEGKGGGQSGEVLRLLEAARVSNGS